MHAFLSRITWMISLLMASIVSGFLTSLSVSGMYDSFAREFFDWGWIFWVVIFLFTKYYFFSAQTLDQALSDYALRSSIDPQLSRDIPLGERSAQDQMIHSPYHDDLSSLHPQSEPQELPHTESLIDPEVVQPLRVDNVPEPMVWPPVPSEPPKPNWIVTFFADRPLAKIGGILLFLGALFFLSLIWTAVGPVGKLVLGILFGFSLYGIGVWMDTRGHIAESRTLMGVGIAINMLTILSGRWMLGEGHDSLLSDGVTLVFLILNTVFGLVTARVYSSRTFLVFSLVFSYLIPFLAGGGAESMILLCLYIAVVSTGAYLLAWFGTPDQEDAGWIIRVTSVGTLLVLISGVWMIHGGAELITYLIVGVGLTILGTMVALERGQRENIVGIIIGGYIMIMLALFARSSGTETFSILMLLLALVPLFGATVFLLITGTVITMLSGLLFAPLIIGVGLMIFGGHMILMILIFMIALYLLSSLFILDRIGTTLQYAFFLGLSVFVGIGSIVTRSLSIEIADADRLVFAVTILVLMLSGLWSAMRYRLAWLPVIMTGSSLVLFAMILSPLWMASWIWYILLVLIMLSYPYIARAGGYTLERLVLTIYQVIMYLWVVGMLVWLGSDIWFSDTSPSLITLGLILFLVSVGSLIYSLILLSVFYGYSISSSSIEPMSDDQKNTISATLALPLSLFSLAVGVVFSDHVLVVSMVWILESTLLVWLYKKYTHVRILTGAIILLIIGLIRMIGFFDTVTPGDWFSLVPVLITAGALFLGVVFLTPRRVSLTHAYDILHIIGIMLLGGVCMQIIPHSDVGWSLLGMSAFFAFASWFYRRVDGMILSYWIVLLGLSYFLTHMVRMGGLSYEIGPVLVQLSALGIALTASYLLSHTSSAGRTLLALGGVCSLIITSYYVSELTGSVFAVTIYLTILSAGYILSGIRGGQSYYRTIGLYIGLVILAKILFYDIWIGLDDLIIRVLALMFAGGIMIGLSHIYGNAVTRSWSEEFSLDNFRSDPVDTLTHVSSDNAVVTQDESVPFSPLIAQDIAHIDISGISHIDLVDTTGQRVFSTRRSGLMRLIVAITTELHQTTYGPGELTPIYQNILPHIRSHLPKKDLDQILHDIEHWIQIGGSVYIGRDQE